MELYTPDQRACRLLTEVINQPWRWPRNKEGIPRELWHDTDEIGIHIQGIGSWLTEEIILWFRNRGWIACTLGNDVYIAPTVEVDRPPICYHTTLAANEDGIRKRGLLRGADVGCSTTGRTDAGQFIYVCFDKEEARRWSGAKLLGKNQAAQEWIMVQIERQGLTSKVFRDPASQSGYILEDRSVDWQYLSVVDRWIEELA